MDSKPHTIEALTDASFNNTTHKDVSGNHADASNNPIVSGINDVGNGFEDIIKSIFTKNNVILIVWFLAIYLIAYYLLGFFFRKGSNNAGSSSVGVILDFVLLAILIIFLGTTFFSYNDQQRESVFTGSVSGFTKFVNEPSAIFSTLIFIIVFYFALYLLRVPMTAETKPFFVSLIESVTWIVMLIIVFIDFFKYMLGVSLTEVLAKLLNWDKLPSMQGEKNTSKKKPIEQGNEVFNISNNRYTYNTAQSVCSAYGARLATYDEIESAYNDGAEWCNYGWSDGQMAYFPTQKSTWTELQKSPKHKNDCGRPGINGGYMANPNIKFGVNCYGKKPKASAGELARMTAKQNQVVPKTAEELALDKKIEYWKAHPELLQVNAFNRKTWNDPTPQ